MDLLTRPLKIVHVFRAPIGGLFRHVVDLTCAQAAQGHLIGVIADSTTGGEHAERALEALAPCLALGCQRLPIRRVVNPMDAVAALRVAFALKKLNPDVVHGHGAKGGAYARLPGVFGDRKPVRAYTPHGGAFNYPEGKQRRAYMAAERMFARGTDLLLFESEFIGRRYDEAVHCTKPLRRVIVNGVQEQELTPAACGESASDLLYIGELRSAKGIDTLLASLPLVAARIGFMPKLTLVGSGPDEEALKNQAESMGITEHVRFAGTMPARKAFALGRLLVVPSRAESLPYIVLEAAGARVPMVATNVGGIPEIFGPYANRLIVSGDPFILADAILGEMLRSAGERSEDAEKLGCFVGEKFSMTNMVKSVVAGYRDALARRMAGRAIPALLDDAIGLGG